MKNLVAFGAHKEEPSEFSYSDVSTYAEEYHVLLNKWLNLKNENLSLQHDLVQSREQDVSQKKSELIEELVEELVEELTTIKEKNESLEQKVNKLREVATGEQERARMLQCDLAENYKLIKMLNSETTDLDKIVSTGKPAKVNWGLGYRGAESTEKVHQKGLSHFVRGSTSKSGVKEVCQKVRQDI
ncbi:hypothetical protein N665_0465s0011 [Sinapis alba]|nr:hypothetical protein N665_0465s0011 [Sinapis alba]